MSWLAWVAPISAALGAGTALWLLAGWSLDAGARHRAAFTEHAGKRLLEAFLFIDPAQVWTLRIVLAAVAAAVVLGSTREPLPAIAAGVVGMMLPAWWLRRLRHARRHRFDTQLPDALLALAGGLRAGASVHTAISHVVREAEAPLVQEFGLMLRQQRLGVSFEDALLALQGRMPTEATVLMVAALRIATETGGDLADALERIAATLRARLLMQGRIHALTAQGRMQAVIVGLLPPLLAGVLHGLEPEAMGQLWRTPMGWGVVATVIAMETCGLLLIRRIVRIDV